MNVLKFGGTSVGSAQRIQEVAKLISDDQPKIVVLSAMSGTTNTLVDITNHLYRNDRQEALTAIQNLELDYLMTISDLYSTEEFKHRGQEFVQTIFTSKIRNSTFGRNSCSSKENNMTTIFEYFF